MSFTQSRRVSVTGYEIVHNSREFRWLRRRFRGFALPATLAFLGWYFLYVVLAAFAPGFMRHPVAGDVNVGLCFGLLEFVSTFLIATGYTWWSRRNLDPVADQMRQRLEKGRPE